MAAMAAMTGASGRMTKTKVKLAPFVGGTKTITNTSNHALLQPFSDS